MRVRRAGLEIGTTLVFSSLAASRSAILDAVNFHSVSGVDPP